MKKRIVLIILLALCAFSISAKPIDVVVMLDTSESVLPIYEDLVNYIVKNVLTNHVRFGDTFHLISFDSKPELIYSRQLQNSDDLEEVVAALFLLNPLGKHTDLIMALNFLNQHVSTLSDAGSSEIIILTDGIHDPPPDSPFRDVFAIDKNTGERINLLEKEINNITRNGWKVSLVKLPVNGKTEGQADSAEDSSGNAGNASGYSEGSKEESEKGITEGSVGKTDQFHESDQVSTDSVSSAAGTDLSAEKGNNSSLNSSDIGTGVDGKTDIQKITDQENGKAENNIFSFTEKSSSKIYHTDFVESSETDNNTATGSPRIIYPEKLGKIKYHFKLPVKIENFYSRPILLKLERVLYSNENILKEKLNIKLDKEQQKKINMDLQLPYSVQPGHISLDIRLEFSDSNRAYPENAVVPAVLKKSLTDFLKDLNIVFKIIFLVIIAALLIIFFMIFFSSFVHVSVRDTYNVIKKDIEVMVSDKGLRPLALKVIGQNDNRIGSRNIHSFNDKAVKTMGGGHSSYLIFLYKLPSHIAEISHSGGKYILTVKNADYFPEIEEESAEIIPGKNIKIKTENSMIIECYFYEYISPLEQINSIMKLTDYRGMPENRLSIYSK